MALAFGLPYVLTVNKPVQVAKGASSYAAGAAAGVPSILAEAGGVGQMQEDSGRAPRKWRDPRDAASRNDWRTRWGGLGTGRWQLPLQKSRRF